jgi:methylated-DNA-[protein]-cysteine S-methyltransferase
MKKRRAIVTWLLENVQSPVGHILLMHDGMALAALDFEDHEPRMKMLAARYLDDVSLVRTKTVSHFAKVLKAYFGGKLDAIDALKTHSLGTPFQAKCWAALRTIPAGETRTYGQQAAQIGSPKAVRAVGLANGANPIGIVVPCHRVIGANGTLTGYGGGLPRKEWLLKHEAKWAVKSFALTA